MSEKYDYLWSSDLPYKFKKVKETFTFLYLWNISLPWYLLTGLHYNSDAERGS